MLRWQEVKSRTESEVKVNFPTNNRALRSIRPRLVDSQVHVTYCDAGTFPDLKDSNRLGKDSICNHIDQNFDRPALSFVLHGLLIPNCLDVVLLPGCLRTFNGGAHTGAALWPYGEPRRDSAKLYAHYGERSINGSASLKRSWRVIHACLLPACLSSIM